MHVSRFHVAVLLILAWTLSGCGSADPPPGARPKPGPAGAKNTSRPKTVVALPKPKSSTTPKTNTQPSKKPRRKDVTFEKELKEAEAKKGPAARPRPKPVDEGTLQAAGFQKLTGKRLTLYTDVPVNDAVKEIPEIWDQAYSQWRKFFGVQEDQDPPWQMRGFLMKDERSRQRLRQMGLIHPQAPDDFPHGFAANYEFWIFEQPSPYYRQHLMLHEGTHGFMLTRLGDCTSPWYMEATAELLGTHLWQNKKLTLRHFPRNRKEVPFHGRIKLVKEAFAQRKAVSLDLLVAMAFSPHDPRALQKADPDPKAATRTYAWCWASSAFLDGHPRYRQRFRELRTQMRQPGLASVFRSRYQADWDDLLEEWQVFISGLEYGYDIGRNAIDFKSGEPLPEDGASATLRADRGWQSSGLRLKAGRTYQLSASGRYVVAQQPKPWECEPGGVTIRYYDGRPLGILLAAVRIGKDQRARLREEDPQALSVSPFLMPHVVGRAAEIKPRFSGTLYFKINDSAAELADNSGTLDVRVTSSQ